MTGMETCESPVPRGEIGHNNPPDPIDEITAAYADERIEAEAWLDGAAVETEAQMQAVDALRQSIRQWRLGLEKGQKSATAPLHDAYKAELARWKPTIEDAKRREGCLVSAVGKFKKLISDKKAEEQRSAWEAANKAKREAEEKAAAGQASDLDAQREADAARQAAIDADKAARAQRAQAVKGMRTVHKHEILDHKAALYWIAKNDRDAMTAFIEEYTRKNFRNAPIDGVKVWTEKEAY